MLRDLHPTIFTWEVFFPQELGPWKNSPVKCSLSNVHPGSPWESPWTGHCWYLDSRYLRAVVVISNNFRLIQSVSLSSTFLLFIFYWNYILFFNQTPALRQTLPVFFSFNTSLSSTFWHSFFFAKCSISIRNMILEYFKQTLSFFPIKGICFFWPPDFRQTDQFRPFSFTFYTCFSVLLAVPFYNRNEFAC